MDNSKKILIIGASGGIGEVLCKKLVSEGHFLFGAGRNSEKLQVLSSTLGIDYTIGDMSEASDANRIFDEAHESLGLLDGVVNLAGSILLKPAHLTSDEDWSHTIKQNLDTAFNTIRYCHGKLSEQSSVVLMSSVAASLGLQNHEAIAAAKAGVEGLTRAAAATYAKQKIRVNAVAPSLTETPMSSRITSNSHAKKASEAMHPLGRIGVATDISDAIYFLLMPSSAWMSGQVLQVDGGLSSLKS